MSADNPAIKYLLPVHSKRAERPAEEGNGMPARTWALPGLSPTGRLSGVWRHIGRGLAPGGRPSFLLRQERRQRRRPGFTGRPSADSPALLTTGGRRRTRPSGSNSCAGLPRPLLRCSAVQTGCQRSTEPLRKLIGLLTVDHLHFLSPLTCRLEVMTGGKRASHV